MFSKARLRFLSSAKFAAAAKGADLALRIPLLRILLLDRVLSRIGRSYDRYEEDDTTRANLVWLGPRLKPFLYRLVNGRPRAARALVRFLVTWTQDMRRRSEMNRVQDTVSPCIVVLELTDRCNLRCPGCYAKSSSDGSDVPFEQMAGIVRQVVDMGVTLITLTGGEPFLREQQDQSITRLAGMFSNRGFLVYTNGTMITEAIALRLGKAGNVFPAISVEGFEHQTDARRGPGVYGQNRQVRKLLSHNQVLTGFSATLTRENAEAICSDDFIDLRIEEGDLFGWFFLLQPIGRSPRPDLMVTADQRAMLRETVHRWRSEGRPIFLGDFWNDGHLSGGCIAAGRYYFHIYANGDISPCVFSPAGCGNVFDIIRGQSEYRTLGEFVRRHPGFQAFRDEQKRITDRNRPCLLIDNPQAFRRVYAAGHCTPAKNMTHGYIDGEISRAIDAAAEEWREAARLLPDLLNGLADVAGKNPAKTAASSRS